MARNKFRPIRGVGFSFIAKRKKRGGLAVRRANYTHRRKGVFNAGSIEDSQCAGNVRNRTKKPQLLLNGHQKMSNYSYLQETYHHSYLTASTVLRFTHLPQV